MSWVSWSSSWALEKETLSWKEVLLQELLRLISDPMAPRDCSAPAWDTALMQCPSGTISWLDITLIPSTQMRWGWRKKTLCLSWAFFHDSTPRLGNCLLSLQGPPTAHHHLSLLPTSLQALRPGTMFFHFRFSKTVVDTELLNIAIFKASWAFLSCRVGQGWG